MARNNIAPVIQNPQLIDLVISQVQKGLFDNLGWLDASFGRAQRLVKMIETKKYFSPNVYKGVGNEYFEVSPDSNIGNFSFFWLEDYQTVNWEPKQQGSLETPFSLIFWFDLRRVFNDANNRNTESIKADILKVLNGGFQLKNGRIQITRIYEQAENIYRGFSLDEIDNQFLMHPFAGFRFDGKLTINEPC